MLSQATVMEPWVTCRHQINRGMLHNPVSRMGEGLKVGAQGQMHFGRHNNRGCSHGSDDQPNTRNCHQNMLQGKERRVQVNTEVPAVLLLALNMLGDPLMPLLWESVFQHSVEGGIVPPDPLGIKLFQPGAERHSKSMCGASRIAKQQVEHHLPLFHSFGRRRSGNGPHFRFAPLGLADQARWVTHCSHSSCRLSVVSMFYGMKSFNEQRDERTASYRDNKVQVVSRLMGMVLELPLDSDCASTVDLLPGLSVHPPIFAPFFDCQPTRFDIPWGCQ